MDKHTSNQASKLIDFTRFKWTLGTAGWSIHSPWLQEFWSYNMKLFQTFCSGPIVTSHPFTLADSKGLPKVSLFNFSPLLSKLNYTPTFLLTLLFQRKEDRSLPELFLYLCPCYLSSSTMACLALSSFVSSISAPSLTSYQSMKMFEASPF